MAKTLTLNGTTLTAEDVVQVARGRMVALSPSALRNARRSKLALDRAAKKNAIYGVTTGFGPMASVLIGAEDLAALQINLVRSHASGAGEPVAEEYVRAAMVVRLNTLLRGLSGVSEPLLMLLRDMLNKGITPLVPARGGVGASGDLIQLSHIALGVIGEGDVYYKGVRCKAADAFARAKLIPHVLQAKEGLALINGTSYMSAIAAFVLKDARALISASLRTGALALEVVEGFSDALAPALHAARPHKSQERIAALLRALTAGSKLLSSRAEFMRTHTPAKKVRTLSHAAQDVYSLRCIPQIVGPVLEAYLHARDTVAIELNAVTDNPLVTPRGAFLHGGNFHGEYVAVAMDTLKISLAKLSMLSERRINFFLNAALNQQFPPFLNLETPGLTLGLQGLQFTATSTAAKNQSLAYPYSLHSTPTNADNQDIVSMGADAAHSALEVSQNTRIVLAAECIVLSQAAATGKAERKLSSAARILLQKIRKQCAVVRTDRPLWDGITKTAGWIAGDSDLLLKF